MQTVYINEGAVHQLGELMKKIIGLGICVLSLSVFADTTYESEFAGKETITRKDKSTYKVKCELKVKKTYYVGNTGKWEDFRAEVETGYGHGKESAGEFVLKPSKTEKYLEAENSDKSTLSVALETTEKFESATVYSLKWNHNGHFHNHVCKELAVVPKAK
jgi:hypothetical protein